jgi:hypothetical protein
MEVAVAQLPIGELVAGNRLHLHVDREQVVTAMGPAGGGDLYEEAGVEPLPHEPSVVVREADDDGIDLIGFVEHPKLIETEHAIDAHTSPSERLGRSYRRAASRAAGMIN